MPARHDKLSEDGAMIRQLHKSENTYALSGAQASHHGRHMSIIGTVYYWMTGFAANENSIAPVLGEIRNHVEKRVHELRHLP